MSAPLRYQPLVKLASGGAATVFVGAARGACGFRQLVALKRPHPHLLEEPGLREALLDEACVASRIHHANVVDVRDVDEEAGSLQLVMDYIEGASLGQLIMRGAKTGPRLPPGVAVCIVLDACAGLHAAHELTDEAGVPLGLVHRDVTPQNILVGLDGVARVTDFGVAKARAGRAVTMEGVLKGKLGYFAPEYVSGRPIDRRADVFAMGVVLWEALAHRRLFRGASEAEALELVLHAPAPPVSEHAPEVGPALDAVVAQALAKAPEERFTTARALAEALLAAAQPVGRVATREQVARAVEAAVGDELRARRAEVQERLATLGSDRAAEPHEVPEPPSARTSRDPTASTAEGQAREPARPLGLAIAAVIALVVCLSVIGVVWTRGVGAPAMTVATGVSASVAPSEVPSPAPAPAACASSAAPPPAPAATAPSAEPRRRASSTAKLPRTPLPPNPYDAGASDARRHWQ